MRHTQCSDDRNGLTTNAPVLPSKVVTAKALPRALAQSALADPSVPSVTFDARTHLHRHRVTVTRWGNPHRENARCVPT